MDDIRTEALEIQLARIGPNCRWEDLLPASMEMTELLHYTDFTVAKLKKTGEVLVTFNLMLGRLMTIASEKPAGEWEGTPYRNFTEYQEQAFAPIAAHGTRFTAMKIYQQLNGKPMEDLEKCSIANLNFVARESEKRNLSEAQQDDLLKAAAVLNNSELKALSEKAGIVPEGEAHNKALTLIGSAADVDYLVSWLKRKDVRKACGDSDITKVLMATGTFDTFDADGLTATQAVSILREMATFLAENPKVDKLLPSYIREKLTSWAGQLTTTLDDAIDAEFQEG